MLPTGHRPVTSWVHYTTCCSTHSSVPEDGKNNFLKHVELTGIINKLLLLHLVSCLYYLYSLYFLRLAKQSQFNPYPETRRKWRAPNNDCKCQMGFNSVFED